MEYLRIEANRQGYEPTQIKGTMTVRELISLLQDFPEEMPVILSHDNGYTYGGVCYDDIREDEYADAE